MIEITNIEDSRIQLYRGLRSTPDSHTRQKVFVAEGEKVFQKLLESNLSIKSMFAMAEYYEKYANYIVNRVPGINEMFIADKNLMNEIVGFRLHEGIMAIADIPPNYPLSAMTYPIVALNGIVNSENVGAIIRNCAAFGCHSVIFDSKTSNPYLRRAVRVSMGTVFNIHIHETNMLIESLLSLKANYNGLIIASEIHNNSIDINDLKIKSNHKNNQIIIFGSEGKGIDNNILNISDIIVSIPISPAVPSLNVAASSAIMLYELRKLS